MIYWPTASHLYFAVMMPTAITPASSAWFGRPAPRLLATSIDANIFVQSPIRHSMPSRIEGHQHQCVTGAHHEWWASTSGFRIGPLRVSDVASFLTSAASTPSRIRSPPRIPSLNGADIAGQVRAGRGTAALRVAMIFVVRLTRRRALSLKPISALHCFDIADWLAPEEMAHLLDAACPEAIHVDATSAHRDERISGAARLSHLLASGDAISLTSPRRGGTSRRCYRRYPAKSHRATVRHIAATAIADASTTLSYADSSKFSLRPGSRQPCLTPRCSKYHHFNGH